MNRRKLKKEISGLCGELIAECVALLQCRKEIDKEDVGNVVLTILHMQNDLTGRLSHVEPGSTRLFFAALRRDMANRAEEIVDQIKSLA